MASSIFNKDPAKRPVPPPFARERIELEIAHLKKPQSTRHGPGNERRNIGVFTFCVILFAIGELYFMDPFFYSWYKGNAIQAYLYLHNYDSDQKARAIVATGILNQEDVEILNDRHGSFQDYYSSPRDAEKTADSIVAFMKDLSKLRTGPYHDLDFLGKIRYNLFCRWGILPPTEWAAITPAVQDEINSELDSAAEGP